MNRRTLLCAPLAVSLARCASPDPAIYTLRPLPGSPQRGGPPTVRIARPGLAGYLDRPEIVRDGVASRLTLNGGERWGEPLGDMVARVLGLDLAQRLPGTNVFTEAGTISIDPAATVELDIQRFDFGLEGSVIMLAQAAVSQGRSHDVAATRSVTLTVPANSKATPDVVIAMSMALAQLADSVAAMLREVAVAPVALADPTEPPPVPRRRR